MPARPVQALLVLLALLACIRAASLEQKLRDRYCTLLEISSALRAQPKAEPASYRYPATAPDSPLEPPASKPALFITATGRVFSSDMVADPAKAPKPKPKPVCGAAPF
jgi:hypothetical protein